MAINRKQKSCFNIRIKKIIFSLLIFSLAFSPVYQARAAAWPVMDPLIKQALDVVWDLVKGVIANVAKQAAIKAINGQIVAKIGGKSSGGAMFVVNWKDYLFAQPEMESKRFVYDYLSKVSKGRGSASYIYNGSTKFAALTGKSYEGVGPGSFRLGLAGNDPSYARFIEVAHAKGMLDSDSATGNWINKMVTKGKEAADKKIGNAKMTYLDDPSAIFTRGTMFNFSKYVDSAAINTPIPFEKNVADVKAEDLAKRITAASSQAISGGGYTGKTDEKGNVSMPGKAVGDMLAKTMGAPIDSLTTAQGLQGMAQAFVTAMVMKFFDQGVGKISARISKQAQDDSGISIQMDAQAKQGGPSALYNR